MRNRADSVDVAGSNRARLSGVPILPWKVCLERVRFPTFRREMKRATVGWNQASEQRVIN